MTSPRFSLVIVTIAGRHVALGACLASIEHQTFRDFEAVIVDQSHDNAVESLAASYPWARYLRVPADGISTSRNVGIQAAQGELFVFPDDDARLAPDFLARGDAAFRRDPALGVISGSVIDPVSQQRILRFPSSPARLSIWNMMSRHCSTSLIAARWALAQEEGPFDPLLGVGSRTPFGSGEETDLVLRLLAQGIPGLYDPAMVVYHPETKLTILSQEKVASYGRGAGACFRKAVGRFGWWPIGVLWLWALTRVLCGALVDVLRGHRAPAQLRFQSFRTRLDGWSKYRAWGSDV